MLFSEAFEIGGFDRKWWLLSGKREWSKAIPRVPEAFWRTIVADRGPNGMDPPSWYPRACLSSLENIRSNGDLQPYEVIGLPKVPSITKDFLKRVQDVIWERRFAQIKIEGGTTYGLLPAAAETKDIVCILFGCSVPVVLRRHGKGKDKYFEMIGECFVYGMMGGEALSGKTFLRPYEDQKEFELR